MKNKKSIYLCLGGILIILLIGVVFHLSSRRNDYFYTTEMIHKDICFGKIVEIHGDAEEPFKRNIPICIAGEGDGTLSWKENGVKKEKRYKAISGCSTYVTTYIAKDGKCIHVVTLKGEPGIISKYSGRYSADALDDQGKEIRNAGHKVIRSQEDYVAFVSGIPKLEIAMTKGLSGKSDDPLLAMPHINFSNQMMVVVTRDGSMYLPPDIESVVVSNGTLTVNYSQRSLDEVAGLQEASGIGTYGAAVVPKTELKVAFKKRDIPPQPPSANGDGSPASEK
jgi:hypothetical protein